MIVTIAIPTYNRANRLEKSLFNLFNEIKNSKNKSKAKVFISDNGSKDFTTKIIDEAITYYSAAGIPIDYKKKNIMKVLLQMYCNVMNLVRLNTYGFCQMMII